MANMIVISGYLAADPEIRTTASGIMVASLRLAVRRKFAKDKDTTDFFNVEAWRRRFCRQIFLQRKAHRD